jgi:hypothetical protein
MEKRRKIETPQQYQQRIESYREYNSKRKNWNIGINYNNGESGISLEEEFEAEVMENVHFRNVPMITEKVEIEVPMSMAFQHIMKTKIGYDELIPDNIMEQIHQLLSREENGEKIEIPLYDQIHQANVCVICDRFITGTAELNWIKKITLLQHKSRLVISDINSELQQCYQVLDSDLHGLLLSPRARVRKNGEYFCCSQCERALKNDKLDKNPPKYAIANNFAIGTLPQQFRDFLTDVTYPLLSPVMPFAYVMSYSGAHKAITGTFAFFNQNVEKNVGVLNFHNTTLRTKNVFVLLSGNFTPNQRHIVRNRCNIDVGNFTAIFSWLRANNPIFAKMEPVQNCPSPIILEDDTGIEEDSENSNKENHVDIQYWFPNNGNPTCSNSVFHSQADLVDALLNCKEPTLIFTSKNPQPDYKLTLPLVFPTHFPFGFGGIDETRRNHVSIDECLKYYLNISLPMFQHSNIILVISHKYFRRKSFQSAYLKCMSKLSLNGYTTGEHFCKISETEILELSKKTKSDLNSGNWNISN